MTMNEQSRLILSASEEQDNNSSPLSKMAASRLLPLLTFVMGIIVTFALTHNSSNPSSSQPQEMMQMSPALQGMDLLGKSKKSSSPGLHYFGKAATDFASTLPNLMGKENSFLADLVTSTDSKKPISAGFYRQEAGEPLVYEYTYHEMKIIVAGEFFIHDAAGNSAHATPGDVFYFPKGSIITFDSPSFGLGFFCGQRPTGEA